VPLHLRNAPTDLARSLGHGEGYLYPHDHPNAFAAQDYLPEAARGARLYEPVEVGDEREVARRLAWWRRLREASRPPRGDAGEPR
jgi:putative ATPase